MLDKKDSDKLETIERKLSKQEARISLLLVAVEKLSENNVQLATKIEELMFQFESAQLGAAPITGEPSCQDKKVAAPAWPSYFPPPFDSGDEKEAN